MKAFYEQQFTVISDYADFKGRLKMSSLMAMFQSCAETHANELGVGFNNLEKINLMWVLVKLKVDIIETPRLYEKVTIKTWPLQARLSQYQREYVVYNEKDSVIVKATSTWCLLNRDTHIMYHGSDLITNIEYLNQKAIEARHNKIKFAGQDIVDENIKFVKKIVYSDIDTNKHFNNCKFAELTMNTFDLSFLEQFNVCTMQINFLNEGRYNDDVIIYNCEVEERGYNILGVNKTQNNHLFEAYCKFE